MAEQTKLTNNNYKFMQSKLFHKWSTEDSDKKSVRVLECNSYQQSADVCHCTNCNIKL
jgi:hypothetical protein